MRITLLIFVSFISVFCYSQENSKISTIDFVEVLNENKNEALYYYQQNWKILRDVAKEQGYIDSYQLLETNSDNKGTQQFDFILITTYTNIEQYERREERFQKIIEAHGALRLLNDKKPKEFRRTVMNEGKVKHWY
nr:hypothetical protein [Allomuricauda sp.]